LTEILVVSLLTLLMAGSFVWSNRPCEDVAAMMKRYAFSAVFRVCVLALSALALSLELLVVAVALATIFDLGYAFLKVRCFEVFV